MNNEVVNRGPIRVHRDSLLKIEANRKNIVRILALRVKSQGLLYKALSIRCDLQCSRNAPSTISAIPYLFCFNALTVNFSPRRCGHAAAALQITSDGNQKINFPDHVNQTGYHPLFHMIGSVSLQADDDLHRCRNNPSLV